MFGMYNIALFVYLTPLFRTYMTAPHCSCTDNFFSKIWL